MEGRISRSQLDAVVSPLSPSSADSPRESSWRRQRSLSRSRSSRPSSLRSFTIVAHLKRMHEGDNEVCSMLEDLETELETFSGDATKELILNTFVENLLPHESVDSSITSNECPNKSSENVTESDVNWILSTFTNGSESLQNEIFETIDIAPKKLKTFKQVSQATKLIISSLKMMTPPVVVPSIYLPMLDGFEKWEFCVLTLDEKTDGNALRELSIHIFDSLNIFAQFRINRTAMIEYITIVQSKYNQNHYHCSIHAADVLHATYYFLNKCNLKRFMSDLKVFATLFAAILHDVGHPGVTNDFLINTHDPLASTYNDVSVLENFHASFGFLLANSAPCADLFSQMPLDHYKEFRSTVLKCILSTDMSMHFDLLEKYNSMIDRCSTCSDAETESSKTTDLVITTPEDVLLVQKVLLHCADLSNPVRPLETYLKWANRVLNEFFEQGDKERQLGMKISPNMDRCWDMSLVDYCNPMTCLEINKNALLHLLEHSSNDDLVWP